MTRRALRQYYDQSRSLEVDPALGSVLDPWLRHRRRFLAALAPLTEEQWRSPTRCTAWNTRDVISHLVTVDNFWVVALTSAAGGTPTRYLEGFDPTGMPDLLIQSMRAQPTDAILEQFTASTKSLVDTVTAFGDWSVLAESPMGHVPARLVLAHGLWDSWLHEYDVFVPLGAAPVPEPDELLVCTWFSLWFAGLQGGLLNDDEAAGPSTDCAIRADLVFDELPADPLRVQIDTDVRIERASGPATPAGSAVALVEMVTGRRPMDSGLSHLPADLGRHLARAAETL